MYATRTLLFNLKIFFTSKPSIFGKFAVFLLSAAHDAINITNNARKVKEGIFLILSKFSLNTIRISLKK